jgi:hypothetical protein
MKNPHIKTRTNRGGGRALFEAALYMRSQKTIDQAQQDPIMSAQKRRISPSSHVSL